MRLTRNTNLLTLPLLLLVVVVVFAITEPAFLTGSNFRNIAVQAATTAMVAVAMTLVVVTAGIDLSVGSLLFLSGVVLALGARAGWPPGVLIPVVVLFAAAGGLFNGLAIGVLRLNPLLATIATFGLFRGIGERLTNVQPVPLDPRYAVFGTGTWLGVPVPVVLAVIVLAGGSVLFRYTAFGRLLRAIGSNPLGARESGITIRTLTVVAYVLVGLVVGLASLITLGRLGAVEPAVGTGFELTVITAVVLGGTSLNGGSGSVAGSFLAALLLATVENGLVLAGASPYWYDIFRALVLIVAVAAASAGGRRGPVPARLRKPVASHP